MMYFFIGYVIWCILFTVFMFGYDKGYKEAQTDRAITNDYLR